MRMLNTFREIQWEIDEIRSRQRTMIMMRDEIRNRKNAVGKLIARLRGERGMSQREAMKVIEDSLGVSGKNITAIENPNAKTTHSVSMIYNVARAIYKVPISFPIPKDEDIQ